MDIAKHNQTSTQDTHAKSEIFQLSSHHFIDQNRSSLGVRYEEQVIQIQKQIGDLETVRKSLGLSARKLCQLLMVDPSAWTRWTKHKDKTPPHIWRALQWYMLIQEKIPGLTPQYFIGGQPNHAEVSELKERIKHLEHAVRVNKITAIMIGFSSLILAFAFYRLLKS